MKRIVPANHSNRARALFAEAADTTAAAFTDEGSSGAGGQELDGFGGELHRSREEARSEMNAAREELAHRLNLRAAWNFFGGSQAAWARALEAGVTECTEKWRKD